jgi:hypothetical protein
MNKDYFANIVNEVRSSFKYYIFVIFLLAFFLSLINKIDSKEFNKDNKKYSVVCLSSFFVNAENVGEEKTELDLGNTVLWSLVIISLLLHTFIGYKAFSKSDYRNYEVDSKSNENEKIKYLLEKSKSLENKINDINFKIDEFEVYFDKLDEVIDNFDLRLKNLEPSNFIGNPHINNAILQETKKEIIYYSESPERDGSFLIADLKNKKSNLTVFKIIKDIDTGKLLYDLEIANFDITKRIISLNENLLKPVCEYINEPSVRSSKIVKVSKELGKLEERNGKYYVIEKIKIRFED